VARRGRLGADAEVLRFKVMAVILACVWHALTSTEHGRAASAEPPPRRVRLSTQAAVVWGLVLLSPSILLPFNAAASTELTRDVATVGQVAAVAVLAIALIQRDRAPWGSPDGSMSRVVIAAFLFVGTALGAVSALALESHLSHWAVVALVITDAGAAFVVCLAVIADAPRVAWYAAAAVFLSQAALGLSTDIVVDVISFLDSGAHALLHGHDAYAVHVLSPYRPADNARFFPPSLLDGRVVDAGFAYPPVVLLATTFGYLLGSVRLTGVLAMGLAVVIAGRRVEDSRAALLTLAPGMLAVFANSWTEPISVLLLVLAVVGFRRGSRWAPVWLGLLLVSKQYFVVAAPLVFLLLWADRRSAPRWREMGVTAASGFVGLVPFALWHPHDFWHSVVTFQFLQQLRPECPGLLIWSVEHLGWPPSAAYGVIPLVAGLGLAGLLAWRGPRHPAGFSAALAVVVAVSVTLSKQGFTNYWFFVIAALLVAWLTWPTQMKEATPE